MFKLWVGFLVGLTVSGVVILGEAATSNSHAYKIVSVVDGDTIKFEANFLPSPLKKELSLRVYGVDTPEKGSRAKCASEAKMGEAATAFTKKSVGDAKVVRVVLREWDKYGGRVLGDLELDGKSLRGMLIASGLARPYFGEAKKSWCE